MAVSTNTVVVTGRAGCFSQRSAEPRNRARQRRGAAVPSAGSRPASRGRAAPLTSRAGALGRAAAPAAAVAAGVHGVKAVPAVAAVARPSHRAAKAIVPVSPPRPSTVAVYRQVPAARLRVTSTTSTPPPPPPPDTGQRLPLPRRSVYGVHVDLIRAMVQFGVRVHGTGSSPSRFGSFASAAAEAPTGPCGRRPGGRRRRTPRRPAAQSRSRRGRPGTSTTTRRGCRPASRSPQWSTSAWRGPAHRARRAPLSMGRPARPRAPGAGPPAATYWMRRDVLSAADSRSSSWPTALCAHACSCSKSRPSRSAQSRALSGTCRSVWAVEGRHDLDRVGNGGRQPLPLPRTVELHAARTLAGHKVEPLQRVRVQLPRAQLEPVALALPVAVCGDGGTGIDRAGQTSLSTAARPSWPSARDARPLRLHASRPPKPASAMYSVARSMMSPTSPITSPKRSTHMAASAPCPRRPRRPTGGRRELPAVAGPARTALANQGRWT